MPYSSLRPLVAIAGPTGSGKSELGLYLAEKFGGEIVNCDSLQVYRYFDIGTAKVPPEHRRGIPHHLIDILDPAETFTAGEYARRARAVINEIAARGRLPLVVGGTGFYLRALVDGLFPGPTRDDDLRKRLAERERRRPGLVHRLLRRLDPASAARIHPADLHKLVRALEVCLLTGRPLSEWFSEGRQPLEGFRVLKIALNPPRQELYRRLDERCARMFEQGLIEEVRRILAMGYPETIKPLEAHGYRQALQVLRGELDIKKALYYARRNTRRYAKRQWTWFRREPGVVWLDGFGDQPETRDAAVQLVSRFLSEQQCDPRPTSASPALKPGNLSAPRPSSNRGSLPAPRDQK
ncbi:MAG: tRNA (adenosine(37)-N6)-dimethylallyltransferase MiaA [Bryobacteraceae bacterium]